MAGVQGPFSTHCRCAGLLQFSIEDIQATRVINLF